MTNPVFDDIKQKIESADVFLFMKGSPLIPQCGFSARVVQVLKHSGVPFASLNVLEHPAIRDGIKDYANWPTIPQLYVKGEFIGGCDIVTEMYQSGELQALLVEKGIVQNA